MINAILIAWVNNDLPDSKDQSKGGEKLTEKADFLSKAPLSNK